MKSHGRERPEAFELYFHLDLENHIRFMNRNITSSCEAINCEIQCQALSSIHC